MEAQTTLEETAMVTSPSSNASPHARSEMCPARQPSPSSSERSHESPTNLTSNFTGKKTANLTEPTPEASPIDALADSSDKAEEQLQVAMDHKTHSPPLSKEDEKSATASPLATSQSTTDHETNMSQAQHDATIHISEQQLRSSYAYCYDRGDGVFTRLVPLDMLPPLDRVKLSVQDNCLGMIVLPQPSAPPPLGSYVGVSEVGDWQTRDSSVPDANVPVIEVQSRIDNIVDSTVEPTHENLTDPPTSRSFDDAALSSSQQHFRQRFQRDSQSSHHSQSNVHGSQGGGHQHQHPPRKRLKIYCDKWVHEGVCAFTQQGCKFKHEMPLDRATQHSLGLFHGLPAWWKKSQQLADANKQQHDPLNQLGQATSQQMIMLPYHQTGGNSSEGNAGIGGPSTTHQDYNTVAAAFDGLQMGPCDNSGNEQQVSGGFQPPFSGAHLPPQGQLLFSNPGPGANNGQNELPFAAFHPNAHLPATQPWHDSPAPHQPQHHLQGPPRSAGLFPPPSDDWNDSTRNYNPINNNFHYIPPGNSMKYSGSTDLPLKQSISEHSPSHQQQHQGVPVQSMMASCGNIGARRNVKAGSETPIGPFGLGPGDGTGQVDANVMVGPENSKNGDFFTPNRSNTGFASRFGPIAPPPLTAHHGGPMTPMSPLPSPAFANSGRGNSQPPSRGGPLSAKAMRFPMSSPITSTAPHHNRQHQRFTAQQQQRFAKRSQQQNRVPALEGGVGGDTGPSDVENNGNTKNNTIKSSPWRSVSENDRSSA